VVLNLGPVFLYLVGSIVMIVITFVFSKCRTFCDESERAYKFQGFLKRNFIYGFLLRLIIEGYLELCISALVNLKYLGFSRPGDRFSSSITFGMSCLVILFPPLLAVFCIWYRCRLSEPQFASKFGSLYDGLDIERPSAVLYYSAFTFRRLLFAWTAVYLVDYATYQIQVFCICSLFYSVYLVYVQPFDVPAMNYIEIFNELGVNIFAFILFLLTPMVDETSLRYLIGWVLIGLVSLLMGANIINVLIRILVRLCKKCISNYRNK